MVLQSIGPDENVQSVKITITRRSGKQQMILLDNCVVCGSGIVGYDAPDEHDFRVPISRSIHIAAWRKASSKEIAEALAAHKRLGEEKCKS